MSFKVFLCVAMVAFTGSTMTSPAVAQFDGRPNPALASSYEGNSFDPSLFSYGAWTWTPAMARVHQEIANRLAIENDLREAEVFWQKRRLYAQCRAECRQKQLTGAEVGASREHLESSRAIKEVNRQQAVEWACIARKTRFGDEQIDHVGGRVAWPAALASAAHLDESRHCVASVLALHEQRPGSGTDRQRHEAAASIEAMRAGILESVRRGEISGNDYIEAKRFLNAVARDLARAPSGLELQMAAE